MQSDELAVAADRAVGTQLDGSRLGVWSEGYIVNDTGCVIHTWQVNVPGPGCEPSHEGWPLYLPVLVKVCERQHLLDSCMKVRLSRPSEFRDAGETLMSDPEEARVSRAWTIDERLNDPVEMARARLLDEEANRAGELVGAGITTTTKETTTRNTRRSTEDRGSNAWLWCSAIKPTNDDEWERLCSDLPPAHDHWWALHSPRMFARALGAMFVDQVGPRGRESKLTQTFADEATQHSSQTVFHGPVAYVDDPYSYVAESATLMERLVRPMFSKRLEYQHQREYRFVVWDESEPEETVLLLDASSALLETARDFPSGPVPALRSVPTPRTPPPSPPPLPVGTAATRGSDSTDSILAMMDDPHINHRVHTIDAEDAPDDLREKTLLYPAVEALRRIVGKALNEPEAAAAAWHAESYVRSLCAKFRDPIESIRLTPDNFIVIKVKFPEGSDAYGNIAVGPRGVARHKIGGGRGYTVTTHRDTSPLGWPVVARFEDVLITYGLPRRGASQV